MSNYELYYLRNKLNFYLLFNFHQLKILNLISINFKLIICIGKERNFLKTKKSMEAEYFEDFDSIDPIETI